MKKIAYTLIALMVTLYSWSAFCTTSRGLGYSKYDITFVDEMGETVTETLTVDIQAAGGAVTPTYKTDGSVDDADGDDISVTDGNLSFWVKEASIDVVYVTSTNTFEKTTLAPGPHVILGFYQSQTFSGSTITGDLTIADAADLNFGTDSDFLFESDTANTLELLPAAAGNDFKIGVTAGTSSVDVYWYGDVSGAEVSFLEETCTTVWDGIDIIVNDDDFLYFGDSSEITMEYQEDDSDAFKIDCTKTVAGVALQLETTDGGVTVNADGAANGDITIDAADVLTLTADDHIAIEGAVVEVSRETQVHTANDTLDNAADVGRLHQVSTDAVVLTLPVVATGLKYKIMNVGADGAVEIHVDTNGADKILGGCGLTALDDGDKITNTKATADYGDYVVIEYGTADGWYITEMVGTWADGS